MISRRSCVGFAPFSSSFCPSLGWPPFSARPTPFGRSLPRPWRPDLVDNRRPHVEGRTETAHKCSHSEVAVFPSPSLQDISSLLGGRLHHPCITRRRLQWDSTARSLFATHTYAHHRFPSLGHWGIGIRIGTPQRQRQPPPLQAKGPLPRTAPHTQPLGQLTCHAWWRRKWGNRRPQHPKQLHSSPDWTPLAALQPSRDMQLPVRVSTICLHAHAPPLTGPFCFFFFSCPSCPENYMFLPCLASLVFTSVSGCLSCQHTRSTAARRICLQALLTTCHANRFGIPA